LDLRTRRERPRDRRTAEQHNGGLVGDEARDLMLSPV
jgi:hypothetical protein